MPARVDGTAGDAGDKASQVNETGGSASGSRWFAHSFGVTALLVVVIATLTPGDSRVEPFSACIMCGDQAVADAISNIALFLPFGAALITIGWRPLRSILAAAVLSTFVEGMQATILPGRDPSLGDVVFNIVGGVFGVLLARTAIHWGNPRGRARHILAACAVLVPCAVVASTGLLLQPAFERDAWYGQWTANFANMERYRGHVLDARIGGRFIASQRLNDGGFVRQALLEGQPLILRVQSSPLTRRISSIFSVYDDRRSEQFLLGANATALDLFVRRRANDARLVNPPLHFENALRGVSGGDTITLVVQRNGGTWCVGVPSDIPCHGYTAGDGWQLLQDIGFLRRHVGLADALWLWAVLVPAGFWLRGRMAVPVGIATVAMLCAAIPATVDLTISPPSEWAGAALGLLAGAVLAGRGVCLPEIGGDSQLASPFRLDGREGS